MGTDLVGSVGIFLVLTHHQDSVKLVYIRFTSMMEAAMETARTSSKGQIVIPKEIRDKVGLKPGSLVEVRLANKHIEIVPLPEDPIKALRGALKAKKSLAGELLKEHRREVRHDAQRH